MIQILAAVAAADSAPAVQALSWQDLAAAVGVVSTVLAIATGYLRLSIAKALHDMRDKILLEMKTNFVFKEAYEPNMHNIKKEITRNESAVAKLEEKVKEIDLAVSKLGK